MCKLFINQLATQFFTSTAIIPKAVLNLIHLSQHSHIITDVTNYFNSISKQAGHSIMIYTGLVSLIKPNYCD